mgnify:CR=1 FL=1
MTAEQANELARTWIEAWNAHDMDAILAHYTDDFEMTTPYIVSIMNDPTGTLKGKQVVGDYWRKALNAYPDLHFTLDNVYATVNAVGITYRSVKNRQALEVLMFNTEGKVHKAFGCYAD